MHALISAAFGRPREANLVDMLRRRANPVISLVAENGGSIIGHTMFPPAFLPIHSQFIMGLAPLAVLPARQRGGVGSALVRAGLAACRR